jgi:hypothetical protein
MKYPFSLKTLRKDLKKCIGSSISKTRVSRFGAVGAYNLIISTGDISDVDGFYALMEYAKTDADVLFIMNYPGYIEGSHPSGDYLGFNFSGEDIKKRDRDNEKLPPRLHYNEIIDKYSLKKAMTNMAFYIVNKVWKEAGGNPNKLFFMIGGVNNVIPFSIISHKNEVRVYSDITYDFLKNKIIDDTEGNVYNNGGNKVSNFSLNNYNNVYMDFNGSMSFFKGSIKKQIEGAITSGKMKGVYVMGGVYENEYPQTMPSIPNILNRLSSATMNQLYHPEYTGDFFKFLLKSNVPVYVITNNEVKFIEPEISGPPKRQDFRNFSKFMDNNGIKGTFIKDLAKLFYTEVNSPYKPFDYYVAKALVQNMNNRLNCNDTGYLYYNNEYGITLYSENNYINTQDIISEYTKSINLNIHNEHVPPKRAGLIKERDTFYTQKLDMIKLPVRNLKCNMNKETKHISIHCDNKKK